MSEANKASVRRLMNEVWNQGKMEVVDELLDTNYINHDTQAPGVNNSQAFKGLVDTYRTAFPDLNFDIEDILTDGEKVITRWRSTGTQLGDLPDVPATGRRVDVTGISITRFEQGKIAEDWANWDTVGMLKQLGVIY